MKKLLLVLLALCSAFVFAGCIKFGNDTSDYKVAMITDYGDITDQSFNQATYEGCKDWCEKNDVEFRYYKPATNSDDDRVASTEEAIAAGYNVIVMPGYAFAPCIDRVADDYPEVKFIALDVALGDLLAAHYPNYNYDPTDAQWAGYELPSNVYCAVYQEEIAGYFAGYAAVKEGYTKLGFLGGMAVPAVVRYGYGFVQGADKAAQEKDVNISINYVYGGQFFGDADITAVMDTWYGGGTEVVFSCGGGIYTSAGEAARKVTGSKIIGVDVDQSATIDGLYGEGMTVTSAMKGLYATVQSALSRYILNGLWISTIETLGLDSATDVESNYVQLPIASWSMKNFTVDDYKALVAKVYDGTYTVSNATDNAPAVSAKTTVSYQDQIK